MAAGAAEKFVWLSKTFSGSFLRAVYLTGSGKIQRKTKTQFLLPPLGFRPEGEIPRRHSSYSRVY